MIDERAPLSASWLSSRLGIDPQQLAALHAGGRVFAFLPPGDQESLYPSWQFDEDGRPRPIAGKLVRAARQAGIDDNRLYELLHARAGLTGGRRLVDDLLEGRETQVLAVVRAAQRI
ncbi:MAG: hypothetical protein ACR2MU_03935 [Gaiellaceae bacterium]